QSNPTAIARSTVLQIGGQNFTITQLGAQCAFDLSATSATHGSTNSTGTVGITTLTGCVATVSNGVSWVGLSSTSVSNSGTLTYTLQSNPTAIARSTVLQIGGQNFTITQLGAQCAFDLSATSATHGSTNSTGTVGITTLTGCVATVSNGVGWVGLSSTSVSNSGTLTYTLQSNPTAIARSTVLQIGGQNFTITQLGAQCAFDLSATSATHGSTNSTGTVGVTTLTGCVWTVSNGVSWVGLSATSVSNSGTLTYTLQSNPTAIARSTVLQIGGQNFTITQLGAQCGFSLSATSATHGHTNSTGTVSVTTLTGCVWTVSNGVSWVGLSATSVSNSGTLTYTLQSNPTAIARSTVLQIGGQNFTITQLGAP